MAVFSTPLVSVAELAPFVTGGTAFPGTLRLLDVRWLLGRPDNHADYLAGHLPGAVFADLDHELAEPPTPAGGRHPLPSRRRLQAAVRRWGLDEATTVVAYDGGGNMSSARLWWVLGDAGVTAVHLLDGALPAWTAAGWPLEPGEVTPEPGSLKLGRLGQWASLSIDEAAAFPERGILLDARAPERFLGLTEPVDPRAGHIPGARNAPTGGNLAADGTFLPAAALRERFAALGVVGDTPVAAYCGSGVTAAHEVFALKLAGFDAALYAGSWSQWSATDRPAATGEAG
jgi:thiosulfate/3-mercaptopyruvate sulfurtransferase